MDQTTSPGRRRSPDSKRPVFGKGSVLKRAQRPLDGLETIYSGIDGLAFALARRRPAARAGGRNLRDGILRPNPLALHTVAEARRSGGHMRLQTEPKNALDPVYAATIGVNIDEI